MRSSSGHSEADKNTESPCKSKKIKAHHSFLTDVQRKEATEVNIRLKCASVLHQSVCASVLCVAREWDTNQERAAARQAKQAGNLGVCHTRMHLCAIEEKACMLDKGNVQQAQTR